MRIAAIIPAYNEDRRIAEIVEKTARHVRPVLVIDDGSTDNTAEAAEKAGAIVVRHPHNLGKGAACRSGFYAALRLGCEAIITLDGDGQHDPTEIPAFVGRALQAGGPCIVLGCRMRDTRSMPFVRLATNRLLSRLISMLARQTILDSQCGFRLIHREILEKVHYNNNRYDAESEILVRAARAGFPVLEVPIATIYGSGYSKINVFWDTLRFVRFFFRHLFTSPPVVKSPEWSIAVSAGESALAKARELEAKAHGRDSTLTPSPFGRGPG